MHTRQLGNGFCCSSRKTENLQRCTIYQDKENQAHLFKNIEKTYMSIQSFYEILYWSRSKLSEPDTSGHPFPHINGSNSAEAKPARPATMKADLMAEC